MYVRESLEAVFPIDEVLITAEDVDMHIRMKDQGFRLGMCPDFFAYHNKRNTVRGFFRQMKRFAIGRVQLWRKNRKSLKSFHWITAIAGVGGAVGGLILVAGMPLLFFLLILFGWLGATTLGLLLGLSIKPSVQFGPALAVFVSGWSVGFISELLFPIRDSTGR
jgi:cellulose synthase/poly-beta-1,6-N-acetylglucosamine synthase-like glycosyltransferase